MAKPPKLTEAYGFSEAGELLAELADAVDVYADAVQEKRWGPASPFVEVPGRVKVVGKDSPDHPANPANHRHEFSRGKWDGESSTVLFNSGEKFKDGTENWYAPDPEIFSRLYVLADVSDKLRAFAKTNPTFATAKNVMLKRDFEGLRKIVEIAGRRKGTRKGYRGADFEVNTQSRSDLHPEAAKVIDGISALVRKIMDSAKSTAPKTTLKQDFLAALKKEFGQRVFTGKEACQLYFRVQKARGLDPQSQSAKKQMGDAQSVGRLLSDIVGLQELGGGQSGLSGTYGLGGHVSLAAQFKISPDARYRAPDGSDTVV